MAKALINLRIYRTCFLEADLNKIFANHLEYYQSNASTVRLDDQLAQDVRDVWQNEKLSETFTTPSVIDDLCYRLSFDSNYEILADSENRLDHINKTVAKLRLLIESSPSVWFSSLKVDNKYDNYRLYALLAGLFEGVSPYDLDEIYQVSVVWLRKEGMTDTFADARQLGNDGAFVGRANRPPEFGSNRV